MVVPKVWKYYKLFCWIFIKNKWKQHKIGSIQFFLTMPTSIYSNREYKNWRDNKNATKTILGRNTWYRSFLRRGEGQSNYHKLKKITISKLVNINQFAFLTPLSKLFLHVHKKSYDPVIIESVSLILFVDFIHKSCSSCRI